MRRDSNNDSASRSASSSSSSSLADRLRRMDAHSSVESEFRVYTEQGAILSLVTVAVILYLTMTEAYYNFTVVTTERIFVNATQQQVKLEMEFDMSLLDVPCDSLSIDANDPTGQSAPLHLDKSHHIWKHRMVYKNGQKILLGSRSKLEQGSVLLSAKDLIIEQDEEEGNSTDNTEPDCGDCFGAGQEGECCNTCEDVQRAYKRKGWVLENYKDIPQCKYYRKHQAQKNEGCNVHGVVALDSGGGNLHLAPSADAMEEEQREAASELDTGKGDHDQKTQMQNLVDILLGRLVSSWNVSHVVHRLRFGPEYPGATYQLDGVQQNVTDTYGMYQYYFQVVPTTYKFFNGTTIQTFQYSVTEHLRHVDFGAVRGLPGVFFFYEVSPLHVEITESYRTGWISFFTSVCAVVGGSVTVMGMIDQYLFRRKRGEGGLAR